LSGLTRVAIDGGRLSKPAQEIRFRRCFQRWVRLALLRCCTDCLRGAKDMTVRFRCEVNGTKFHVRLARWASKDGCEWIRRNVGPINPGRPEEQQRVQQEIDQSLGRSRIIHSERLAQLVEGPDGPELPFCLAYGVTLYGLIDTVAREKSAGFQRLQPSIRRLGPERVLALVRRILLAVADGTYDQATIAAEFGIDEAALSRFAGANWEQHGGKPPPLFRNAAHILLEVPAFAEFVKDKGMWERAIEIGASLGASTADDRLYWLPILAAAVKGFGVHRKLLAASARIAQMGGQARYAVGHRQFIVFMKDAERALSGGSQDADAAGEALDRDDHVGSGTAEPPDAPLGISLVRDGRPLESFELSAGRPRVTVTGVKSGVYSLVDQSGRELWSAALTERHLVWRWAHPGLAIPMAAADADQRPKMATLQVSLLDGRLQVCVSAALALQRKTSN